MKVICTNPDPCHMCAPDFPPCDYVKGRAYTVTGEIKIFGKTIGYKLAELPLPLKMWHCVPHFAEIEGADTDIFSLAEKSRKKAPERETEDA
jgi:hypothetical protein